MMNKIEINRSIGELDNSKLPELLELKYRVLASAKREFSNIPKIRETLIGFQEWLYNDNARKNIIINVIG
tara:strand:- start:5 stop:214 length:210 start_codon:yes stop_codon:yes gene_type:complete